MILGILQTGHVPAQIAARHGDYTALYGAMFPGRGYRTRTFGVVDGVFPDGAADADAWLVSGSRHGTYEDHAWIAPLEALLRDIRARETPLVGVCFGHQIVAQALGGRVEKSRGGWCVGRQDYTIAGRSFSLNAWHRDQVVDPPPEAVRLGASETCENAVLAYGDRILTLQPHPEFGDGVIEALIAHRGQDVPKARLRAATAALGGRDDNAAIRGWLADVLEGAPADRLPFAAPAPA